MNVVYKISFLDRIRDNKPPYYYIGSKSNCTFDGTNIIDKRGNAYFGSSKYNNYKEIVSSSTIKVDILYKSKIYKDVLIEEARIQTECDAMRSPEYFNLSIANTVSNFTEPDTGTFMCIADESKIIRLKIDDPLVVSGMYVGVTKGKKTSDESKQKRKRFGEDNHFFGKSHTEETKEKIKNLALSRKYKHTDEFKNNMSLRFKGVPKSEEHKNKIGRKGLITLKCPTTLITVRIEKGSTEHEKYTSLGYLNPYTIKMMNPTEIVCPHCNKKGFGAYNMKRWHFDNCKEKK